ARQQPGHQRVPVPASWRRRPRPLPGHGGRAGGAGQVHVRGRRGRSALRQDRLAPRGRERRRSADSRRERPPPHRRPARRPPPPPPRPPRAPPARPPAPPAPAAPGPAARQTPSRPPHRLDRALPLSALLSQALVAYTIEFDNEAEHRLPHRTTSHGASGPGD